MWDHYSIEQQMYLRHEENLRRAAQARLVREARRARARGAPGAPALHRRLLHWFGGLLVAWGSRLQGYAERPELARLPDGLTIPPVFLGLDDLDSLDGPFGAPSPTADSPSPAPRTSS